MRVFRHRPPKTPLLQKSEDEWGPTINFVLLRSPLLASRESDTVIVSREHRFIRGSCSIITLFVHQSGSVPVHPFGKSFGTLAVTGTVHVSPSSRTLISILVALQMRAHIRLCFGATHFKTQAEHLNTTTLSMFSSMGPAVCFLIPNANSGSLPMSGR